VKFSVFNGVPYGALKGHPRGWPVANTLFERERGPQAFAECIEEVELADALGFDWIACAEHHYSPGSLVPNVNILAGVLSQHVKRARIAVLGALVPLGNPVRIAEEYAMIDNLSGGRLIAGLMRGAPYEYLVYNVNPAESRDRFEEAWDLIVRAWTDTQPFGWEGDHYHFRNVSIWPRPVQQPTPPVFISGSSRESGELAARKRVGLGLAFTTRPLAAEAAAYFRECASAEGWQPAPEQVVYQVPVYVSESDQQAYDEARPCIEGPGRGAFAVGANRLVAQAGFFGHKSEHLTRRFQNMGAEFSRGLEEQVELGQVVCGGPETVVAQLRRLGEEIGAGVINCIFHIPGLPRPNKLRSMQLFAHEVIPAAREL
jgi:alkanesulfonate monooxygenase SsuD/methylene tetrahydromethanopterin reductase-like flavin-dependent oxidoreductase (luciferase family)